MPIFIGRGAPLLGGPPHPGGGWQVSEEAGVKRVVLTHLVPNVPDGKLLETFVEGVQKFFPGDVVVAKDLMSF